MIYFVLPGMSLTIHSFCWYIVMLHTGFLQRLSAIIAKADRSTPDASALKAECSRNDGLGYNVVTRLTSLVCHHQLVCLLVRLIVIQSLFRLAYLAQTGNAVQYFALGCNAHKTYQTQTSSQTMHVSLNDARSSVKHVGKCLQQGVQRAGDIHQ